VRLAVALNKRIISLEAVTYPPDPAYHYPGIIPLKVITQHVAQNAECELILFFQWAPSIMYQEFDELPVNESDCSLEASE
jgi:hypothetical protein